MYKKILAAIDGSDCSHLALKEAINLAKDQKAKLLILHVIENLVIWQPRPADVQELQTYIRNAGQEILTKGAALAKAEGIEPETKLVEIIKLRTRIAELIIAEAIDWSADLLVISTHGRRGFHRVFLGSVAEGIIRHARLSVLLVPSKE